MDSRLDENKAELGVLVLAVALEVLANGNSLEGSMLAHFKHGHRARRDETKIAAHARHTFLISMYRSSGSSGARPVKIHSVSLDRTEAKQEACFSW